MSDRSGPSDRSEDDVKGELRDRAEAMVQEGDVASTGDMRSPLRTRRLIHELQVHQAELEMQAQELAETQVALQSSLRRYTDLYDNAPVGYVTLDEHGRISSANVAAVEILSSGHRDIIGDRFERHVLEADRQQVRALVEGTRASTDSGQATCTVKVEQPDGPQLVIKLTATRSDDCLESRVSLTDITALERERQLHLDRIETIERMLRLTVNRELELIEMKATIAERDTSIAFEQIEGRLHVDTGGVDELEPTMRAFLNLLEDLESVEQLRMITRMKDRFVALVSHELRTPLTSISGFTSTLLARWDEISDLDRREFLRIIDDQADRMIRLVNDLLILSRIHAGELVPEPVFVDVADEVARAIETFPGADVANTCPQGRLVYVDRGHLHQAIVNYIGNAIKYGDPPIAVSADVHESHVDIRVVDHGTGVSDDFVPQLFMEFAQAERAGETTQVGTGLGLSIVRQLMRAQGAEAWYEPNEPHGARFVLRIPTGPGTTPG